MEKKPTLVLGVIGADVHAIGNKILDHALSAAGFRVVNIGVLSSQEEFVEAAKAAHADVILVSSLYGHGEIDCRGLKEKCEAAGLNDVLLYAGGNLVIGKRDWQETRELYEEMGFDRVYPPGTMPEEVINELRYDLEQRG